jgi:predicted GIY-YIG superfamily endonuclease
LAKPRRRRECGVDSRAYVRIKRRAIAKEKCRKRGNAEWKPELYEKVSVKTQLMSDAVRGIT